MEPKKIIDNDTDFKLWKLLSVETEIVHEVRGKELAKYGLTVRQSGVLYTVFKELDNNAKPAEIARFSERAPNSITSVLNRMERNKLIKKN